MGVTDRLFGPDMKGTSWKSLSIPKGGWLSFNDKMKALHPDLV
jgi:hypothetical protein